MGPPVSRCARLTECTVQLRGAGGILGFPKKSAQPPGKPASVHLSLPLQKERWGVCQTPQYLAESGQRGRLPRSKNTTSGRVVEGRLRHDPSGDKLLTPGQRPKTCCTGRASGQRRVSISKPKALAAGYHRLAVPPLTSHRPRCLQKGRKPQSSC